MMAAHQRTAPSPRTPRSVRETVRGHLLARQKQGGITVIEYPIMGSQACDFALFGGDLSVNITRNIGRRLGESSSREGHARTEEIQLLTMRMKLLNTQMADAVANHDFEKARALSNEE